MALIIVLVSFFEIDIKSVKKLSKTLSRGSLLAVINIDWKISF